MERALDCASRGGKAIAPRGTYCHFERRHDAPGDAEQDHAHRPQRKNDPYTDDYRRNENEARNDWD